MKSRVSFNVRGNPHPASLVQAQKQITNGHLMLTPRQVKQRTEIGDILSSKFGIFKAGLTKVCMQGDGSVKVKGITRILTDKEADSVISAIVKSVRGLRDIILIPLKALSKKKSEGDKSEENLYGMGLRNTKRTILIKAFLEQEFPHLRGSIHVGELSKQKGIVIFSIYGLTEKEFDLVKQDVIEEAENYTYKNHGVQITVERFEKKRDLPKLDSKTLRSYYKDLRQILADKGWHKTKAIILDGVPIRIILLADDEELEKKGPGSFGVLQNTIRDEMAIPQEVITKSNFVSVIEKIFKGSNIRVERITVEEKKETQKGTSPSDNSTSSINIQISKNDFVVAVKEELKRTNETDDKQNKLRETAEKLIKTFAIKISKETRFPEKEIRITLSDGKDRQSDIPVLILNFHPFCANSNKTEANKPLEISNGKESDKPPSGATTHDIELEKLRSNKICNGKIAEEIAKKLTSEIERLKAKAKSSYMISVLNSIPTPISGVSNDTKARTVISVESNGQICVGLNPWVKLHNGVLKLIAVLVSEAAPPGYSNVTVFSPNYITTLRQDVDKNGLKTTNLRIVKNKKLKEEPHKPESLAKKERSKKQEHFSYETPFGEEEIRQTFEELISKEPEGEWY